MKKLLVFVVFAGWAVLGSGQVQSSNMPESKNVVKFLPANLFFQSISFEYERMINAKNSLTLGIGLPNKKSLIGKYGIDAGSDLKTAALGTMHVRAAYRHYTHNQMLPQGFYIEPNLKYQHITGNASITGVDDLTDQSFSGNLEMKLNAVNLGFQLGYQFLIAKRVSLDLYFAGLEAGFLSGNVTSTSNIPSDAINIKSENEDAIADMPSFIGNKLTVTQSGNNVNVKAKSIPYPWFRGGISFGFAF